MITRRSKIDAKASFTRRVSRKGHALLGPVRIGLSDRAIPQRVIAHQARICERNDVTFVKVTIDAVSFRPTQVRYEGFLAAAVPSTGGTRKH